MKRNEKGTEENFRKLRLEDFLLCTPYEKRNNRDLENIYPGFLTEELFYNKLYLPPVEKHGRSQNIKPNDSIYRIPISITPDDNSSVSQVEASLKADTPESIFISGYSGTGKTTFIRTLLYKIINDGKDRDYKSVYFNMRDSKDTVNLFKIDWENKYYNKNNRNIYKLYSLILSQINSIMNKGNDEDQVKYKEKLKKIYNNYKTFFNLRFPDQKIEAVFSVINTYINGETEYINTNSYADSFCRRMHDTVLDLVNFNENEIKSSINQLIMLICIFLFCSSAGKTKYFFLYDNIEQYSDENVFYDNDIPMMVNSIHDSHKNIDKYFNDNNIKYSCSFKLILAACDVSMKMIDYSNEIACSPDIFINVSFFFDLANIIRKKISYFSKNTNNTGLIANEIKNKIIKPRHDIIKIVEEVLSDQFILSLYNYNKRRAVKCLTEALKNNEDIVERYKFIMKKVKKKGTDNETLKAYKNGAENIIFRILLDLIQTKNIAGDKNDFFKKIKAVTEEPLGFGYTRRILTYINNKADEQKSDQSFTGFYTLIKDVFEYPYKPEKIPDNLIKNAAETIYYMTDNNIEKTSWCQLIVLKFKDTSVSINAIERQIEKQYCNDREDDSDYGLKITKTGKTFVYFSPAFEYYACRYCHEKPPLFSITDREQVISLLDTVKTRSMQCIDRVTRNAKDYLDFGDYINYETQYSSDNNPKNILFRTAENPGEEQTHVTRVIINHIQYLNDYRLFLINEKLFDQNIIMKVIKIIEEYKNKLNDICLLESSMNGITYYYLGNKYIDKYKCIVSKYEEQISKAIIYPSNKEILITGR